MPEDRNDLKNPVPHDAPKRETVHSVIEMALKAGNGAITLLSGLLAAVLILTPAMCFTIPLPPSSRPPAPPGIC